MSSYLSWMDQSEHARRQMLDVIDLFAEQDTRDELGLGSVRDAFSDLLFPGTSTIQTRAKYFLFVPWIYLLLERRRTESAKVAQRARQLEIELIYALAESDDRDGIIGIEARESLQRLPSNIYWQGLRRLGIRLFSGSQDQYHNSLDSFYHSNDNVPLNDDPEAQSTNVNINWQSGLLNILPGDFPENVSFSLSRKEAKYLEEQIFAYASGTCFAFFVDRCKTLERVKFPWEHLLYGDMPENIKEYLDHARNFSEIMWGASLLYNLMLAETVPSNELIDKYTITIINEWWAKVEERYAILQSWDRRRFWDIARMSNPRIAKSTQLFIECWINLVLSSKRAEIVIESPKAHYMINNREVLLKRGLARLTNRRALENWNGASGDTQISYRWRVAQLILNDILTGLGLGGQNARA